MPSVLQTWVMELPFMQQSVLLSAIRGPDTHSLTSIKPMVQWLRRCILISSLDQEVLTNPHDPRGGKFTGPSYSLAGLYDQNYNDYYLETINKNEIPMSQPEYLIKHGKGIQDSWPATMMEQWDRNMSNLEYLSNHYVSHFRDAAQVLAYKHPDGTIRGFWEHVYRSFCKQANMRAETMLDMDIRLDDYRNKKKEQQSDAKAEQS